MLTVIKRQQLHRVIPFALTNEASWRAIYVVIELALGWQKSSDVTFSLSTLWALWKYSILVRYIHVLWKYSILVQYIHILLGPGQFSIPAKLWPSLPLQHASCCVQNSVLLHLRELLTWVKVMTWSYQHASFRALSAYAVGLSRCTKPQGGRR